MRDQLVVKDIGCCGPIGSDLDAKMPGTAESHSSPHSSIWTRTMAASRFQGSRVAQAGKHCRLSPALRKVIVTVEYEVKRLTRIDRLDGG